MILTLVLNYNIGGDFVVSTSDTRVIGMNDWHDFDVTSKNKDNYTVLKEKDIKAHKLTNKVLISAGGVAQLSTYIIEKVKSLIKPHFGFSECVSVLEYVLNRENRD